MSKFETVLAMMLFNLSALLDRRLCFSGTRSPDPFLSILPPSIRKPALISSTSNWLQRKGNVLLHNMEIDEPASFAQIKASVSPLLPVEIVIEEKAKEDELKSSQLPASIVMKVAKNVLPEGMGVGSDAKLALLKASTLFINYLVSAATQSSLSAGKHHSLTIIR